VESTQADDQYASTVVGDIHDGAAGSTLDQQTVTDHIFIWIIRRLITMLVC
jgi:hypothetical protein